MRELLAMREIIESIEFSLRSVRLSGDSHDRSNIIMTPERPSAKATCEPIIEDTGTAVVSGDYETFASHFLLPFTLETMQGVRTCVQEDEFRAIFDAVHAHLTQMRVTLMARNCVAAEYRDSDTIVATHETRLISHGQLIEDPFPVMSIFVRQEDDSWKSRAASYYVPEGSLYQSALKA